MVSEEHDALVRHVLWFAKSDGRLLAVMACSNICKPKLEKGLILDIFGISTLPCSANLGGVLLVGRIGYGVPS